MLTFYFAKNVIFITQSFVVLVFVADHFISKIMKHPVYTWVSALFFFFNLLQFKFSDINFVWIILYTTLQDFCKANSYFFCMLNVDLIFLKSNHSSI